MQHKQRRMQLWMHTTRERERERERRYHSVEILSNEHLSVTEVQIRQQSVRGYDRGRNRSYAIGIEQIMAIESIKIART